jgi:Ca2+-binding RTX toxin-like protein
MQYDNPILAGDVKDALTANTSISATTADAISQILNLDNAETVAIGSWDGVGSVVAPTGSNAQAIFADIAGAAGTDVTVDLTTEGLADAKAFVFASDANLTLDFTAAPAVNLFSADLPADDIDRVIVSGNGSDHITVGDGNTTVDTGAGNDTVTLGNGDNVVIANSGDNQISTGTGRDTIYTGTGNDTVDAGEGYDVAHVAGSRADFAASVSGNSLNLNGGDHAVSTSNVEFISFDNGESIVVASTDEEAAALRLYNGLLGRDADAGGAEAWGNSASGIALTDIAQDFLGSTEFQNNMNSEFIQSVYTTLLGRDADAGGEAAWLNVLAQGASRADVIAGISGSNEGQGASASADDSDFVKALYTSVLGREADDAGLDSWVAALTAGVDRASIAQDISSSAESSAKSASDFIDELYTNALGRTADAEGKAAWTNALEHGATQAEVAIGIVGSDEGIDHNGNVVVVHGVA